MCLLCPGLWCRDKKKRCLGCADTYDRLVLGFSILRTKRLSSFSGVPRRRFLESLSRYESKMVSRILWCMRNSVEYSGLRPKQGYRSTGTKKNVCRMYRVRTPAHSRHGLLPPNTNHKQENHGRIKWILVLRYLIHFLAKSLI